MNRILIVNLKKLVPKVTSWDAISSNKVHCETLFSRGALLIRPIRVCAAGKGMVFKVLSLKLGIQFHQCLEQGVFLDWRPFKECEICNTNIFS